MKRYLPIFFVLSSSFNLYSQSIMEDSLNIQNKDSITDEVFQIVENPAEPPGGYQSFYEFVAKRLRYPSEARKLSVQGKVYIQFIVDTDGSLTEVQAVKGIGAGCDEEAIRVIDLAPNWSPASQRGEFVRQRIILPITFKLGNRTYKDSDRLMTSPEFPGGNVAFEKYKKDNLRQIDTTLPPNKYNNIIHLTFTVDSVGSISNVKALNSLGPKYDIEAIRLYSEMPKWKPATFNEKIISADMKGKVNFGKISVAKLNTAYNYFTKGVQLYNKNKKEKAILQFSKAIDINPTMLDYYFNRAFVYLELGLTQLACNDLKEIKDRDAQSLLLFEDNCQ